MIKTHAGLKTESFSFNTETTPVSIEALKSMCNLAYNSRDIAERCYKNGIFEEILKRIARYRWVLISWNVFGNSHTIL